MKKKSTLVIPSIAILLLTISPIFMYFCGINYIFIVFIDLYAFLFIKNIILGTKNNNLRGLTTGENSLILFNVIVLTILFFYENINITTAFLYSNVPIILILEFLFLYNAEKLSKYDIKLYVLFLIVYVLLYNFYYKLFINMTPLGLGNLIKYTFKIIGLYIPFIPIQYAIITNKKIQIKPGFLILKILLALIGYYFWYLRGLLFSIPIFEISLLIYISIKKKKRVV